MWLNIRQPIIFDLFSIKDMLAMALNHAQTIAIYSDKQNRVRNLKCQLSRAITKITMIPL